MAIQPFARTGTRDVGGTAPYVSGRHQPTQPPLLWRAARMGPGPERPPADHASRAAAKEAGEGGGAWWAGWDQEWAGKKGGEGQEKTHSDLEEAKLLFATWAPFSTDSGPETFRVSFSSFYLI